MIGGGMPEIMRLAENNNSVALEGVPIAITSGYVDESATIDGNNNLFLGFSTEYGKNRATDGTAEVAHYGSVRNQANAVNIAVGTPMDDGNMGVILAGPTVRFMGALETNNNVAQAQVGATAGLTKDSNNYWYIDPAKNNQASGGCIVITSLVDAIGTAAGKLEFSVIQARVQNLSQQT
jgi:hypothetical protein